MHFINKLERKYGRFGIPNLMRYMIGLNIVGSIIGMINSQIYVNFLMLDFEAILHGQVWRIVTFLLYPSISLGSGIVNLVFYAIMLYLYYFIGNTLERIWGTFRFNLYYFSGIIITILATLIYYLIFGVSFGYSLNTGLSVANLDYLNQAMFLTFAFLFPDTQFLLYFVIPIKAKWLGLVYLGFDVYQIITCVIQQDFYPAFLIVGVLVNFFIFYMVGRNPMGVRGAYQQKKRKVQYEKQTQEPVARGPRHRCAVCGRTELDAPNLEFRYCSKCEGNYEYCSDHLFTHEHVHH